jgi:tRNA nucleotidyltransferase (CCA-adding enzyme)
MQPLNIFLVGGAVRDALLGTPIADKDYVVVGASPKDLLELGFLQVGADFPVFLHPETQEEYALARTERKSAGGYLGFTVNTEAVTLEEDLSRRDLTINAMAIDADGELTDPFGGQADLRAKLLRHVGPAFREDPVRILRIGRFLARYGSDWAVAPETEALIKEMIGAGEANYLQAERVWKELSRGLMEPNPSAMLSFWERMGLFELAALKGYALRDAESRNKLLAQAVSQNAPLEVRVALAFDKVLEEAKVPLMASQVSSQLTKLLAQPGNPVDAESRFLRLEAMDALRQMARTELALTAYSFFSNPAAMQLKQDLATVSAVDVKAISSAMPPGPAVGAAIRAARVASLNS